MSAESPYDVSCKAFNEGRCRSCPLLAEPAEARGNGKYEALKASFLQAGFDVSLVAPLVSPSRIFPSRNKAKMWIGGTLDTPLIGYVTSDGQIRDLPDCPLSADPVNELLQFIKGLISEFSLTPYQIASGKGELKGVIISVTENGENGMLRFILRSTEALPRVEKALTKIRERFPWIKVATANIQPKAAAIMEGEKELPLTSETAIAENYNGKSLYFGAQSFMQVTHEVAETLYAKAAQIVADRKPKLMLDLYCGVGGFLISSADSIGKGIGIELSLRAIEYARRAAESAGIKNLSWIAGDVDVQLKQYQPGEVDLLLCNPPRRGLSHQTAMGILDLTPQTIIYSSCNPETLLRDITKWRGNYRLVEATPFDMFPLTRHIEVLVKMERSDGE